MGKLLRRNQAEGTGNGSAPEPAAAAEAAETAETAEAAPSTEATETTEMPAAGAGAGRPTIAERRDTYEIPTGHQPPSLGAVGDNPPIPYEPAPPPPPPPRSGGLLSRTVLDPGEMTAEERDRIAAMEFEQAIAPVMDLMRASVPGANTLEDAARILSENQPEPPRDTGGGAYVPGDAFDHEARVYYRLLRRDYERNPRPSQKQPVSHHLHGVYSKLTGTKGW